jgi:spore coat polysaccharide biosynthesis protein SpsF
MSNTVIIVQARMQSTRLPGKVLLKVKGKPLLVYLLERLLRVKLANEVVIATTTDPSDDPIVEVGKTLGVSVYRGSMENVLDRYLQAAKQFKADVIVRVTADCPLLDPEVVDQVIREFTARDADYASNTLERTWPRGMDVEVFSRKALAEVAADAKTDSEREHVTLGIYTHPEKWRLWSVVSNQNYPLYRWTVDTDADFSLISKILETLYPQDQNFTYETLLFLMKKHPEWAKINAHIRQKS